MIFDLSTLALGAALASAASAQYSPPVRDRFVRMQCQGETGTARMDPIVNFGAFADHSHHIMGGGDFAIDATYETLVGSKCTSCLARQDKSAYWVPSLHFVYKNGTTVMVPQAGGMLVYYKYEDPNTKPFPKGFKLLSGDKGLRNFSGSFPDPPKSSWPQYSQFDLNQRSIGFNCMNYKKTPEPSFYRHTMPDKGFIDANCADGLRLEKATQGCWNGKDLDSKDHQSHTAYPSLVDSGSCPSSHPIRLPTILFEIWWQTYNFVGQDGEYVLSTGDKSGAGYHVDFMNGWEDGVQEKFIAQCDNPSGNVQDCPVLNIQSEAEAKQCKFQMPQELKRENCQAPMQGLPGGVRISDGPAYVAAAAQSNSQPQAQAQSNSQPQAQAQSYNDNKPKPQVPAAPAAPAAPAKPSSPASSQAPPAPPAPATTPAPKAPVKPEGCKVVSTSTRTEGNNVYEMVICEEEVVTTVTTTAAAGAHYKRHLHQHAHARRNARRV